MTPSPLTPPLSYTLAQAAQRIGGGVSERKLRDMVRNGVIGYVWHANGKKAIPESAIVEYLESRYHPPACPNPTNAQAQKTGGVASGTSALAFEQMITERLNASSRRSIPRLPKPSAAAQVLPMRSPYG